ncbi:DUF455 family protein [Paenibacillus agricola]|uniref:DUF455 family protein n=1 Tax=Paenibacillus agricola TaxID=2716264 RepID=A0ABX0IZX4_9BACL|nr:DUF455 family protein [Paenibacillus agricola]NHN28983.1 hypothetical protein [Paenibacillus agricola]
MNTKPTNIELRIYAERNGQQGFDITKTVDLFRRFAFIEHSCVRALAGWFLKVPKWETKLKLGYLLFGHAERVYDLQGRLEELRGGHREANTEPSLAVWGEELVHAPDEACFLSGYSKTVQCLAGVYRDYLEAADRSANAMEIRILRRHLVEIERELQELKEHRVEYDPDDDDPNAVAWVDYLASLLAKSGGMEGMKPRVDNPAPRPDQAHFAWPMTIQFDERIETLDLGSYESKLKMPLPDRRIGEFEVYFNEFYAAALLATIIYDSWKVQAPRQFFLDIAHHFWDEVRHAEFGALRLREAGVEPTKVNMVLFDQSRNMPFLHRICYLALDLEIYFMPRKRGRVRYYEQEGDGRSQLFADVDWSDEMNHVRYGKQWVDYFLRDDARTVEELHEEIAVYLKAYKDQLSGGPMVPW